MIGVVLGVVLAAPNAAGAQYGGVSGLFVTISPTNPRVADFTGLGCQGGDEVVLYMPGLQATSSDPGSDQDVPGRVLAVTTALATDDEAQDGTFAFPGVSLPAELEPGTYAVHARCGPLDLRVLVRIDADGAITLEPDTDADVTNRIPEALPFTGRQSSRLVSLAAGLVAAGVALWSIALRTERLQRR